MDYDNVCHSRTNWRTEMTKTIDAFFQFCLKADKILDAARCAASGGQPGARDSLVYSEQTHDAIDQINLAFYELFPEEVVGGGHWMNPVWIMNMDTRRYAASMRGKSYHYDAAFTASSGWIKEGVLG